MSEKDITPKAMASYMERHSRSFASIFKTARRVKIEQNHNWRIRLLPVQMGPDKEPFVDIAQHWWSKQPITCPRHTSEAWGGDPNFPCPICEISERLRESSVEKISDIGYSIRCNLRVRAWCIVHDMEDARGIVDDMPMSEILNPYEFDMYRGTWESFAKYQKWALSGRRAGQESALGLLDLKHGCDLIATQGAKGVVLERCDPSPIFPVDDPKFDSYLKAIWSHIHTPRIVIPEEKELLDMAQKIEEDVEGLLRREQQNTSPPNSEKTIKTDKKQSKERTQEQIATERLRRSMQELSAGVRSRGEEAGRDFVRYDSSADAVCLRALLLTQETNYRVTSVSELAKLLSDDDERADGWEEYWAEMLGAVHGDDINDPEWVQGFLNGALEMFRKLVELNIKRRERTELSPRGNMTNQTDVELNESTVRSQATRRGLKLEKARTFVGNHLGPSKAFRVIDRHRKVVVFGGSTNGYGCSLDECAAFIANS